MTDENEEQVVPEEDARPDPERTMEEILGGIFTQIEDQFGVDQAEFITRKHRVDYETAMVHLRDGHAHVDMTEHKASMWNSIAVTMLFVVPTAGFAMLCAIIWLWRFTF